MAPVTQWKEDWSSASVVSHTTVTDPTIRQPGFDLPSHMSLMNHFPDRSRHSCDCGQQQTVNHVVDTCPLTKCEDGLNLLHEADDDTVIWLESTVTAAFAK